MMTVEQLLKRTLSAVPTGVEKKAGTHTIGLVTELDRVPAVAEPDQVPSLLPFDAMMSRSVAGIDEQCPITEAAELMQQRGTQHLLVLKAGTVVGILTVRDLLRQVSINEL